MNFQEALSHMQGGGTVTRRGWNGAGQFAFMRPEWNGPAQVVVEKVESLPQSVKDYFANLFDGPPPQDEFIYFHPYLCLKAVDESIINGWQSTQTDLLATDWLRADVL